MLRMLSRPPTLSSPSESIVSCLTKLREFTLSKPTAFSQVTRQQIVDAQPNDSSIATTLYFSAYSLWRYFTSAGDLTVLACCADASLMSFSLAREPSHKRNALLLWLMSKAPEIIPIADLRDLTNEVSEICTLEQYACDELRVTTMLLQAHVGVVKSANTSGETGSSDTLLRRNQSFLQELHNHYKERTIYLSDSRTSDEQNAWSFLLGLFPVAETSVQTRSTLGILQKGDLAKAIQAGVHGAVYSYVDRNYQEIQRDLQARLAVKFAPEDALYPEGTVFTLHSQERAQMHPTFARAVQCLRDSHFDEAEALFSRLSREVEGTARDICKNYQAFALGRQGELADARGLLRSLTDARFQYPSAYWNYACFAPSDQPDLQMRAVRNGIESCPHPIILRGLVSLALLLDDRAVLKRWLPVLTLSEALLLSFYLDHDDFSVDERESAIVRLNYYRRNGEPSVPDPLVETTPGKSINEFMNEMLERSQQGAFEFWLQCRPARIAKTLSHLSITSDFFQRTGRLSEALTAFGREIKARINRLERGREDRSLSFETKRRAEQWLITSMTPQLREAGSDIFRMIKLFDGSNTRYRIMPDLRRIREYFDKDGSSSPAPEFTPAVKKDSGPTAPPRVVAGEAKSLTGLRPSPSLDLVLASMGAELYHNLRDSRSIPQHRLNFVRIGEALDSHGHHATSKALSTLVSAWNECVTSAEREEREKAFTHCLEAFGELEKGAREELDGKCLASIRQLLEACRNVNRSLSRQLELLPHLGVTAVELGDIIIDTSADQTSFSVRVNSDQAHPVRIVGATATADNGKVAAILRDPVTELPVLVSQSTPAIITFGVDAPGELNDLTGVDIGITYEFAGEQIKATPILLRATLRQSEQVSIDSPFIHGRKIDRTEVAEHFCGRAAEQAAILEAISNSQRPKICYVEGIRRAGKSSLLESIDYVIGRDKLPLIPVAISCASIGMKQHVGLLILDVLEAILSKVNYHGTPPTREECLEDPERALRIFLRHAADQSDGRRLVIILDDLQVVEEILFALRSSNPVVFLGFVGFLNFIWQDARPGARVAWALAGHRALRQLQVRLPEVLLWNALKKIEVKFLELAVVAEVVRTPLRPLRIDVPDETVERIYLLTAGYPEVVQIMTEKMLLSAGKEHRTTLVPYDAIAAAHAIAESVSFENTWYPRAQLSDGQKSLLTAFVNAVPLGGKIEAFKLVRQRAITPEVEEDVQDLVHRQILDKTADGIVSIKAYVLELWLRGELAREDLGKMSGSVAIFVDVANLTRGSGAALIDSYDGTTVQIADVLRAIERFANSQSPAPRGPRWAVNYPQGSPAVAACNAQGYQIKNIPPELYRKATKDKKKQGADDIVLREQIAETEQDWPRVNNYIIVTGDIDYSLTIKRLLGNGKSVRVFSWRSGKSSTYDVLATSEPKKFTCQALEDLLAQTYETAS